MDNAAFHCKSILYELCKNANKNLMLILLPPYVPNLNPIEKSIFGEINTLVGVAGITAALSLLCTDYTITPIKSTIYFVFIEMLLVVGSFLASTNAFLGLVITFAIIFFISYQFTYNTKNYICCFYARLFLYALYTC